MTDDSSTYGPSASAAKALSLPDIVSLDVLSLLSISVLILLLLLSEGNILLGIIS